MKPFETMDHKGDAGIIAYGSDLQELFAHAAMGMFDLLAETETIEPRESWTIEVEAAAIEDLLRRWLSDLNYRHITRDELYTEFDIETLDDTSLCAEVRGEPIDPERHQVHTEIKAVTWHQLSVTQTDDGWEAHVIFDL